MAGVVALAVVTLAACATVSLVPAHVTPLPVDVESRMIESDGQELRVDLYRPRGTGRHAAAIVLHGSGGIHAAVSSQASQYAQALAAQGISAFVLHYFDGTGDYTANDSVEVANYSQWVRDVKAAVSWVRDRPDVQSTQVGLVGLSLGAWLAVGAAADDPRISHIVLFGSGLEPFLRDRITRMPPVLMFHGSDDTVVPVAQADTLARVLRAKRVRVRYRIVPGEGHDLSDSAATNALARAARFLKSRRGVM